MFDKGREQYRTDVKLGERYRDPQTGIEGVATAVSFYQYACERVSIETVVGGKIEEYGFDAPRLEHVGSRERPAQQRTGGPGQAVSRPGAVTR